ncbi:hypothetical protein SAMN04488505_103366 [Chitinophaga rupis]|uniref:Type VI secretion system baseplate subunit TssF n=1 Tax=Chitinophaga rupis TaxID=573321 RepID=A0A1H7VLG4_9BACT|nr:type VI secretion system baseplate subunit TssF [Chitinophaga rupis]SEM09864.1 hypothetical protein SAMN04488505_103366 [Chitinophaga rupis]
MKEQKERIKDRMLKTAARLWGYPDAEVETSFDPVVQLLLEACASELEKISNEVDVSHARLVERLAQIMMPEPITTSQPAYGILHATSNEPATNITPDHQFFYTHKTGGNNKDLFFSPLSHHRLFRGHIRYMAVGSKLYESREFWFKEQVLQGTLPKDAAPNHLWLGLAMDTLPDNFNGLSFFFDLRNVHQQEMFYHYLPLARFFAGDAELPVNGGYHYSRNEKEETVNAMLDLAFDTSARYSREVLQRYRRNFLTVNTNFIPAKQRTVPLLLQLIFGKEATSVIDPNTFWIRIEFPETVHHSLLEDLYCSINCLPVINRKVNEQSLKLNRYLNIIPLHTPDIFFDVKKVYDLGGANYHVRNFTTAGEMQEGDLVVRSSGIGRFDSREAKEIIAYLIEVIRDESSLFEEVKNDYVAGRMRELHQLIASLEEQLQPSRNKGNIPYLMVKPRESAEYLFVEFYTTNGTLANNIRMGSHLQEYGSIQMHPNSITLVTNTQGGKDRLNIDEKINQYRYHLLTHDRIVTPEDIKALCKHIMGKELSMVTVTKGTTMAPGTTAGYSRSIDIRITLVKPVNTYSDGSLTYLKDELMMQLRERSPNNYPYRIFMNETLA